MKVTSWGRLEAVPHQVISLSDLSQAKKQICKKGKPGLVYGMGRSYGDVCLNSEGRLWNSSGLNHFISFDRDLGVLTCEAGTLLRDIQKLVIPNGWVLPVTPGTQLVTVGGAIANDIHGKSHHVSGSFGDHILSLELIRTDGEVIECAPDHNADWFMATVGGLGLTGVILTAKIQLKKVSGPWLETETIPYTNLDEFFKLSEESSREWEHTVSWIDCVAKGEGRGLYMRGNFTDITDKEVPKSRSLTMPFTPPISLVNKLSLRLFNMAYFNLKKTQTKRTIMHYEPFFYPLDNLLEWNRMYGPKGFYQYQSVIPKENSKDATKAMLKEIALSGEGSFLAVLKTFGDRKPLGMLSFPQSGVTLALDFSNNGSSTHKLFKRLDDIVSEAKGRLYPAKDARMPKELFEAGYPRLSEFLKYKDEGISSSFSRRLIGS